MMWRFVIPQGYKCLQTKVSVDRLVIVEHAWSAVRQPLVRGRRILDAIAPEMVVTLTQ